MGADLILTLFALLWFDPRVSDQKQGLLPLVCTLACVICFWDEVRYCIADLFHKHNM